jgi:hypothetical protein
VTRRCFYKTSRRERRSFPTVSPSGAEASEAVATECRGLPAETVVFVSEPVTFTAEVRTFVLDGLMLDAGVYVGTSEVTGAVEFGRPLAQSMPFPRTSEIRQMMTLMALSRRD